MGPQNSDPNNPSSGGSTNPIQPDLSSSLNPPQDTQPVTPPQPESSFDATPPTPSFGLSPADQPLSPSPLSQPTTTTPEPSPLAPEPAPIETPPQLETPAQTSPLDSGSSFNWSNPGGSSQPMPTAPSPEPTALETNIPPVAPTVPEFSPAPTTESAPTDLSQLAGQAPDPSVYTPPLSQPETLVVPSSTPEPTTLQADGGGRHIPKWVIFVGAGLLLAVVGASVYFILGIGQNQETESLPATEQQTLITPPVASPIVQQPTPATSSAGFGAFSTASPSASPLTAFEKLQQSRSGGQ